MFHVSMHAKARPTDVQCAMDHSSDTARLATLIDRRNMLRGAAGLAAMALGTALTGSVAHASSATFPISIDATQLMYRYFVIPGVTTGWVDSRTVQTFNLAPGQYSFQVA